MSLQNIKTVKTNAVSNCPCFPTITSKVYHLFLVKFICIFSLVYCGLLFPSKHKELLVSESCVCVGLLLLLCFFEIDMELSNPIFTAVDIAVL